MMKNQKLYAVFAAAFLAFGINNLLLDKWMPSWTSQAAVTPLTASVNPVNKKNTIQVALLLDTSGSMSGLIEQAKSQLWQILNTLAKTEREGQETKLEIALYEYGNPTFAPQKKQIRQLSGFTNDMDLISQKLFALSTGGGDEYCGQVILTSIEDLKWGQDDSNMKMIYIAGNEAFTQGPINYAKACQLAKSQDIFVNTIFCGNYQEGVQTMWKQGAELGRGEYMNIDHNQATTYIETPYDDKINDLNKKLNKTYIPYGKEGEAKMKNQTMQDANASSYSKANAASRAAFKSSKKYKADSWDLVDAYEKDKSVAKNNKALPETMQSLSTEELEAQIQKIAAQREAIKSEIQQNNMQRLEYIEKNTKENAEGNNLQKSIEISVENQAKQKGYKIKN